MVSTQGAPGRFKGHLPVQLKSGPPKSSPSGATSVASSDLGSNRHAINMSYTSSSTEETHVSYAFILSCMAKLIFAFLAAFPLVSFAQNAPSTQEINSKAMAEGMEEKIPWNLTLVALDGICKQHSIDHSAKIDQYLAHIALLSDTLISDRAVSDKDKDLFRPSLSAFFTLFAAAMNDRNYEQFIRRLQMYYARQSPRDVINLCNSIPQLVDLEIARDEVNKAKVKASWRKSDDLSHLRYLVVNALAEEGIDVVLGRENRNPFGENKITIACRYPDRLGLIFVQWNLSPSLRAHLR